MQYKVTLTAVTRAGKPGTVTGVLTGPGDVTDETIRAHLLAELVRQKGIKYEDARVVNFAVERGEEG